MKLSGFRQMDPTMLVGLVNTELRNHCESMEDLAGTHGLDSEELLDFLAEADFHYRKEINQFR